MTGRNPRRGPRAVDGDRRRFLRDVAALGIAAWVGPLWMAASARAGQGAAYAWPETARSWRAMGTLLEVRVPDLPPAAAVEAVGRVRRSVEALEAAMTLFRRESPLVALNDAAPGSWVPVPEALAHALCAAARAAESTGGAYDPTVTRALRAWGLYNDDAAEPGHPPDAAWMRRAGVAALEVTAERARRRDPATEIDLGGIGKGIAVDAALAELARAGSEAALVNLGGSIGVLGPPRDSERGWPVGIVHPDRPGEVWTTGWLRSGHLATSGDYERWVQTPRGRVHHLIDPRTGEPARGVASVTVWSRTGMDADVASTATFVRVARGERPEGPHVSLCRRPGGLTESRVGVSPGDALPFDLECG